MFIFHAKMRTVIYKMHCGGQPFSPSAFSCQFHCIYLHRPVRIPGLQRTAVFLLVKLYQACLGRRTAGTKAHIDAYQTSTNINVSGPGVLFAANKTYCTWGIAGGGDGVGIQEGECGCGVYLCSVYTAAAAGAYIAADCLDALLLWLKLRLLRFVWEGWVLCFAPMV